MSRGKLLIVQLLRQQQVIFINISSSIQNNMIVVYNKLCTATFHNESYEFLYFYGHIA